MRLLQVVLTIGLMAWLLKQMAWSSLPSLLVDLRWGLLALSVAVMLLSHLINVIRWQYLLPHGGVAYSRLLTFYGAGIFSNSFLPTGYGGDSVRVVLLSQSISLRHSLFSVGLDRFVGLIALSALLGLGLWGGIPPGLALNPGGFVSVVSEGKSLLPAVFIIPAISVLVFFALCWQSGLCSRFSSMVARLVGTVEWSQWTVGHLLRLLAGGYVISVFAHICVVVGNWVLLLAVGIEVTPAASVWLVLAGALSLLFPITINGLGVREAVFVTILGAYNVPSTAALLAAVLGRLIQTLFVAAGGAAWLLSSRGADAEHAPSSTTSGLI
jgi:uncharacterized membrane protein YbhN (UPF0104 family)